MLQVVAQRCDDQCESLNLGQQLHDTALQRKRVCRLDNIECMRPIVVVVVAHAALGAHYEFLERLLFHFQGFADLHLVEDLEDKEHLILGRELQRVKV
eukprot:3631024-Rhodomonas_salina.2